MTAGVGRADLLRALVLRGEAGLAQAGALLGLSLRPEPSSTPPSTGASRPGARERARDPIVAPTYVAEPCRLFVVTEFEPRAVDTTPPPDPLTPADRKPRVDKPPPHRPLLPWRSLQPWVRRHLARDRERAKIDVDRLVDRWSRGLRVARIPRVRDRSLSQHITVVVDHDARLAPFFPDQLHVVRSLAKHVARRGLDVVLLPHGVVGLDVRGFDPAVPTLLLTDLGAYGDDDEQAAWRAFARPLVRAGGRLAALIPAPRWRWSRGIDGIIQAKTWDRSDSSSVSLDQLDQRARALLERLCITAVAEPGLLRDVRLLLPADEADAGTEADAWVHAVLSGSNPTGLSIDRKWAAEAVERWRELPADSAERALRREVIDRIDAWHSARGRELDTEDVAMTHHVDPGLVPHDRVADAARFLRKAAGTPEQTFSGLLGWSSRVLGRLPGGLDEDPVVGPAIRHLRARVDGTLHGAVAAVWQMNQTSDGLGVELVVATDIADEGRGSLLTFVESAEDHVRLDVCGGATRRRHFDSADDAGLPRLDGPDESDIPSWAVDAGDDKYGHWADVEVAGVRFRMRWIELGTFVMGSPKTEPERFDNEPRREVTIADGFWMADATVTQELWHAVMESNPSHFKGPRRPVEQVSWHDAVAFLEKVNEQAPGLDLRLPSEEEWEYACRAGTTTPFSFGDNITPEQVNYDGNYPYAGARKGKYRQHTVDVGSLPANPWGLHEMHGNVWEWCEDLYEGGPRRVLRGGSWVDVARYCRSATRVAYDPSDRFSIVGFRVARGQGPEPKPRSGDRSVARSPEGRGGGGAERRSERPAFHLATDRGRWRVDTLSTPPWATSMGRDRFGLWATVEIDDTSFRLRWVPPGRFTYGSPKDEAVRYDNEFEPRAETIARGFWIAETPCTQHVWQKVTDKNPSYFKSPDRPVEQVGWDDVQEFLNQVNQRVPGLALRLPSEIEWEYACRAGTTTSTYAGQLEIRGANNGPVLDRIAWYGGNSGVDFDLENGVDSSDWPEKQHEHTRAGTRPVGRKDPNRLGLHDMLGNVWEWCADLYEGGPGRVLRGGSWFDDAWFCRSATRSADDPSDRSDYVGFRVARGQGPESSPVPTSEPERGGGAPEVAEP